MNKVLSIEHRHIIKSFIGYPLLMYFGDSERLLVEIVFLLFVEDKTLMNTSQQLQLKPQIGNVSSLGLKCQKISLPTAVIGLST